MGCDQPQFSPLDKRGRQIRVIVLKSGNEDQQIVCEHEIVSLEMPGEYEALSYYWGSREHPQEIMLNGAPFRISPSLGIVLRYLRQADDSRRLWVDAICINQEQNDEKLHQVAQMRSIYESASQVLVWLGPPLENSAAGFDLMEAIATHIFRVDDSGNTTHQGIELSSHALAGILELLRRPYWYRMWIVQEIAVASKDPLVGCGTKWLPWLMFGNALSEVYVRLSNAETDKKRGKHHQLQVLSKERFLTDAYTDINSIRREVQGKFTDIQPSVSDLGGNRTLTNLLQLLAKTRNKLSTDPRDRIYALLGLIRSNVRENSKLNRGLSPDYSKTPWRVFREATKFAIESEGTLEVLQYKNHLNCAELPSWVPDFSTHWSQTFPTLGPDHWHDWSASGPLRVPSELRFRISLDLETLYAHGAFVDFIEHVVDLQRVDTAVEDVIRDVHNTVFDSLDKAFDPTLISSRYLVDALWRSLIGNRSAENALPANEDYRTLYLALVDQNPTEPVPKRRNVQLDFRPFTDSVLLAVRHSAQSPHRRFIISKTGLFGLAPPDCQQGDSICILFGYKMPVILRPLRNCHRLLGSAYVHTMMHGEGVPSWELGQKRQETFIIR